MGGPEDHSPGAAVVPKPHFPSPKAPVIVRQIVKAQIPGLEVEVGEDGAAASGRPTCSVHLLVARMALTKAKRQYVYRVASDSGQLPSWLRHVGQTARRATFRRRESADPDG